MPASSFNKVRAKWAEAALEQHQKRVHDQKESKLDQVAALLCNLNHWADLNGVDFGQALENAGMAYEAETVGLPNEDAAKPKTKKIK